MVSMYDDLISFLRARLDETEQLARATRPDGVKPAEWFVEPWYDGTGDRCDLRDRPLGNLTSQGALEVSTANHIAHHDPANVLADVEAKRRILGLYQLDFNDEGEPVYLGGYGEAYWDVVRLLALPYADHPDYREEWRP